MLPRVASSGWRRAAHDGIHILVRRRTGTLHRPIHRPRAARRDAHARTPAPEAFVMRPKTLAWSPYAASAGLAARTAGTAARLASAARRSTACARVQAGVKGRQRRHACVSWATTRRCGRRTGEGTARRGVSVRAPRSLGHPGVQAPPPRAAERVTRARDDGVREESARARARGQARALRGASDSAGASGSRRRGNPPGRPLAHGATRTRSAPPRVEPQSLGATSSRPCSGQRSWRPPL